MLTGKVEKVSDPKELHLIGTDNRIAEVKMAEGSINWYTLDNDQSFQSGDQVNIEVTTVPFGAGSITTSCLELRPPRNYWKDLVSFLQPTYSSVQNFFKRV